MKVQLSSAEFREKVKAFIKQNIHAHIPNFDGSSVLTIPQQPRVAFSRPIDPRLANYEENRQNAETKIARTVQVHKCGQACMKITPRGFVCKRHAPFPLAEEAWIDENGNWGPKRTYGYFNNWNLSILQAFRSNHDIKLITNGLQTNHIAWYITHYVAKKQKHSSNTSALLAKTFAFHHADPNCSTNLSAINKKLIQQCTNSLTREQELSSAQVISYIMGWGDRFISHHFEAIYWYLVIDLLKKTFPVLDENRYVLC